MTTKKPAAKTTTKTTTKQETEAEKAAKIVSERMTLAARILCDTQATFNGADVVAVAGMIKDAEW